MFAGHETRLLEASSNLFGVPALDALAQGVGAEGSGHEHVTLSLDGFRVTARLAMVKDDSRLLRREWVDFSVCFEDRAPPLLDDPLIELRTETATDAAHKQKRLVREVQLGIPSFDRRVFVDNRCSDEEVRRLLSHEDARAAVLLLLGAKRGPINISARQVSLRLRRDTLGADFDVERLVLNLVAIASAGPPAVALKEQRGDGLLVTLLFAAAAVTGLFFAAIVAFHGAPLEFLGVGLLAAGVTAAFSWLPMERFVRGDSGSGARRRWVVWLLAFVVGGSLTALLTALNVAFDDSPATKVYGHVSELRKPLGRRGRGLPPAPLVRWADGEESPRDFDEPVSVGTRCSEERHPGALGATWRENLRVEPR